ncbi:MAG: hypothetical protein ACKOKE_04135 [Actinomycetota bacterium]
MRRVFGRAVAVATAAVILAVAASPGFAQTADAGDRDVVWVRVADRSLPELLAVPEVAALAAAGGAAIAPASTLLGTTVDAGEVGDIVRDRLAASTADRVLVLVVGTEPPAGDALLPIVVAEGDPTRLLATTGAPRALTSDSTHRDGVVTAADVLATANAFWGGEVPRDGAGAIVHPTDAAAPLDLHRRFLERSRSLVPVGAAFAILATVVGLGAIAALVRRERTPALLLRALAWAVLAVPGLSLTLLFVGHLPTLTVGIVLPAAAVGAVVVTGHGRGPGWARSSPRGSGVGAARAPRRPRSVRSSSSGSRSRPRPGGAASSSRSSAPRSSTAAGSTACRTPSSGSSSVRRYSWRGGCRAPAA